MNNFVISVFNQNFEDRQGTDPVDPVEPVDPVNPGEDDEQEIVVPEEYSDASAEGQSGIISIPDTGSNTMGGQGATGIVFPTLAIAMIAAGLVAVVVFYLKRLQKRKGAGVQIDMKKGVIGIIGVPIVAAMTFLALTGQADQKNDLQQQLDNKMLSISVNQLDISVDVTDGDTYKMASQQVKVTNSTDAGYTLSVYADNRDLTTTTEQEFDDFSYEIKGLSSTTFAGPLTRNTWGMAITNPSGAGSNEWYSVPDSDGEARVLKETFLPTPENDTTTVYYGVNAGSDLASGDYANTINYVAVAKFVEDDLADQDSVVSYADSRQVLSNPDRGLYTPTYIQIDPETNLFGNADDIQVVASTAKNDNISLIHLRVNLSPFSGRANGLGEDKPITEEQVESIDKILDIIRKYGLKVIFRFSYDVSGYANREPISLDTLLGHIESLGPLFTRNKDMITSLDVGMIGPFGEMHSVSGIYAEPSTFKAVIDKWLDVLPEDLTATVRTPAHYKMAFGSFDNDSPNKRRLGIFNDGYLGSSSDLGSFTEETTRDDFINWMNEQGNYTFYGGEVTKPNIDDEGYVPEMEPWSEGSYAAYEMPLTHTSYFNSQFNLKILNDKWKNQVYQNEDDEYNGETYYKYLTDHIGYRILIRDSKLSSAVVSGEHGALKLKLENVGFARLIQKQDALLILEQNGVYYKTRLDVDMSELMSQSSKDYMFTFNVPSDIETGEWNVYFKIASKDSEAYDVKFANADVYNEDLGANLVGKITVSRGAKTGVKFTQLNTENPGEEIKGNVSPKPAYAPARFTYVVSGGGATLGSQQLLVARGSTIDFSDDDQLRGLGMVIPEGYQNPMGMAGFNNWTPVKQLTIPNDDTTLYWITVMVEAIPDPGEGGEPGGGEGGQDDEEEYPSAVFTFLDDENNNVGAQITVPLAPGTVLDVDDPESLAALGVNPPEGYYIAFFQNIYLAGNWDAASQLTIPTDGYEKVYWITAHVRPNP